MQEVVDFLKEQGAEVGDSAAREHGRGLVRDAVDEILGTADEIGLRRMANAEKVFLAVQEDLVRRGVISPTTAYERHRAFFGTA